MNFLFWNTAERETESELASLVADTQPDLIALAEYSGDETALLRQMRADGSTFLLVPKIACDRITLFSRFPSHCFHHKRDADRYTIKEVRVPGSRPLLMAVVHLPSKLHHGDDEQHLRATHLREVVESVEAEVGHSNTVIFGDFNMNPFDKGMISASALNSVPCARVAAKQTRTIDGEAFRFFYNPSWNLLGDHEGPPGTYFHRSPALLSHYWNTLDQVIVRPSLSKRIDLRSMRVLVAGGAHDLLSTDKTPRISDHLPLTFSIDLSLEQS